MNNSERELMFAECKAEIEGRPSVYMRPSSTGSRTVLSRYDYLLEDRLLMALRREHGQPRYDLEPERHDGPDRV